jgi:hypothetical protein
MGGARAKVTRVLDVVFRGEVDEEIGGEVGGTKGEMEGGGGMAVGLGGERGGFMSQGETTLKGGATKFVGKSSCNSRQLSFLDVQSGRDAKLSSIAPCVVSPARSPKASLEGTTSSGLMCAFSCFPSTETTSIEGSRPHVVFLLHILCGPIGMAVAYCIVLVSVQSLENHGFRI